MEKQMILFKVSKEIEDFPVRQHCPLYIYNEAQHK